MTMQHNKKWVRGLAAGAAGLMLASTAQAQITLAENEDGWKVMMMGLVSVWSGIEDFDEASGRPAEQTTRVITGFNPSKLEFLAFAPEYNGISVSAYFQLATSINGAKTRRTGEQIEVRAADSSAPSRWAAASPSTTRWRSSMIPAACAASATSVPAPTAPARTAVISVPATPGPTGPQAFVTPRRG